MIESKELVNSLISYVKPFLYHYNTVVDDTLSINGTLTQTFIPFSNTIGLYKFYVSSYNDPELNVMFSSGTLKLDQTIQVYSGWNTININSRVVSKDTVEVKFVGNVSFGATSIPFGVNCVVNGVPSSLSVCQFYTLDEFVRTSFSYDTVGRDKLPRVIVDSSDRRVVRFPYLDRNVTEEEFSITFDIYSIYPSEIDNISNQIETSILYNRNKIISDYNGIFNISHWDYSSLSRYLNDLLTRSITFNIKLFNKFTLR